MWFVRLSSGIKTKHTTDGRVRKRLTLSALTLITSCLLTPNKLSSKVCGATNATKTCYLLTLDFVQSNVSSHSTIFRQFEQSEIARQRVRRRKTGKSDLGDLEMFAAKRLFDSRRVELMRRVA